MVWCQAHCFISITKTAPVYHPQSVPALSRKQFPGWKHHFQIWDSIRSTRSTKSRFQTQYVRLISFMEFSCTYMVSYDCNIRVPRFRDIGSAAHFHHPSHSLYGRSHLMIDNWLNLGINGGGISRSGEIEGILSPSSLLSCIFVWA